MNKKMREIMAAIQAKTAEAKQYTDGENKDLTKAQALMDEVDALRSEYELEKKIYETEKMTGIGQASQMGDPQEGEGENKLTSVEILAKSVRAIMKPSKYGQDKALTGFVDEDGGYTVPEDVRTQVNHWPDVEFSFLSEIDVENVSTVTGQRTYQKRGHAQAFYDMEDDGSLTNDEEIEAPKFERISYAVKQKGGFMPVPNTLLADSDAAIYSMMIQWLGQANVATANKKILAIINDHAQTNFKNMAGLRRAVTLGLGQIYKSGAKILTNDFGLDFLDSLEDSNGRPLLNPDPTDSAKLALRCGSVVVPVKVIPKEYFASTEIYSKTKDTDIIAGKTYYTLSGSVYTPVESPVKGSISTYYEVSAMRTPFIVGDLKAGIKKYDRQSMALKASDSAVIGTFNAFASNMTLIRALMRDDYRELDPDAYIPGFIDVPVI